MITDLASLGVELRLRTAATPISGSCVGMTRRAVKAGRAVVAVNNALDQLLPARAESAISLGAH